MKIEIEKSPRRERYAYGRRSIVSPLSPHAGIQSVIECDYDPQGWIFWKKKETVSCRLSRHAAGRWLSRDPIEEQGGLNLYAHCENNPISYTDELGLKKWTQVGVVKTTKRELVDIELKKEPSSSGGFLILGGTVTWDISGEVVCACGEEKRTLGIQKRFLSKKEADIHCLSISGNLPPGATTFATLAAEVVSGLLLQKISDSVCFVNPGSRKEARRLLRALTREPAVRASFWGKDLCNS